MKRKWPVYLLFITLALGAGALSGWLIADSVQAYEQMPHPPGSPPAGAFPWVWSFLYLLMGVSAARIWLSPQPCARSALLLWGWLSILLGPCCFLTYKWSGWPFSGCSCCGCWSFP